MNIKKEDNFWIVKPTGQNRDTYYVSSYEKALYYAAYFLLGDTNAYESLKHFHKSLRMALNKKYTGNLGDRIDFTGQWWYPTAKYVAQKQFKKKKINVTI